jgi:hypothetical protein
MRTAFAIIPMTLLLFGCASVPHGVAGVTGAEPANLQARTHGRHSDGGHAAPAQMSMCGQRHMMKGMAERGCAKESHAAERGSPDAAQEHGSTDAPHDHGAPPSPSAPRAGE